MKNSPLKIMNTLGAAADMKAKKPAINATGDDESAEIPPETKAVKGKQVAAIKNKGAKKAPFMKG